MWDGLDRLSRALGGAVFSIVLALRWFHAQFIKPAGSFVTDSLLRSLEESIKVTGVVSKTFALSVFWGCVSFVARETGTADHDAASQLCREQALSPAAVGRCQSALYSVPRRLWFVNGLRS
jgi:hypothetical protein